LNSELIGHQHGIPNANCISKELGPNINQVGLIVITNTLLVDKFIQLVNVLV